MLKKPSISIQTFEKIQDKKRVISSWYQLEGNKIIAVYNLLSKNKTLL